VMLLVKKWLKYECGHTLVLLSSTQTRIAERSFSVFSVSFHAIGILEDVGAMVLVEVSKMYAVLEVRRLKVGGYESEEDGRVRSG
jgi:hypothetical protein